MHRKQQPTPGTAQALPTGSALLQAVAVMDRLRAPGGCPWDAEQTHASLAPYAVEEAYEVVEAAEAGTRAELREELGDLLLQVLFHARIAAEDPGGFDIDDVAATLIDKLTYRHPHVFADDGERGLSAQQVTDRWEVLKAARHQRESVLEGIPASLPALARAQKVLSRAQRAGLVAGAGAAVSLDGDRAQTGDMPAPAPAAPGSAGPQEPPIEQQIGDALLDLVRTAQQHGVDAEAALRGRIRRLEDQVHRAER